MALIINIALVNDFNLVSGKAIGRRMVPHKDYGCSNNKQEHISTKHIFD
jgi:hypothetical protein